MSLDHIVHLSAPGELPNVVDKFKKMGFHVHPGGKHADGLTENALIILADGVYIELLQFTNPVSYYTPGTPEYAARTSHWWARMKERNWIDFSLGDTTTEGDTPVADTINARAQIEKVDVSYDKGNEGGRIKPDGEIIRWLVTFPSSKHLRGGIPFFCKDLTPRDRRVPSQNPNSSRIVALTLMALKGDIAGRVAELSVALGSRPERAEERDGNAVWTIGSPSGSQSIELHLISAYDEESEAWTRLVGGIGVWEIALEAVGSGPATGGGSGIGHIKWVY